MKMKRLIENGCRCIQCERGEYVACHNTDMGMRDTQMVYALVLKGCSIIKITQKTIFLRTV